MKINHGQNNSKRLSPRQIINRFRKGEYVDEGIEAISSTISSCNLSFDCNAVPFQTSIVEKVFENIAIAKAMYERQKQGQGIEDIAVPDYPQLREILTDLSYPPLWEALQDKKRGEHRYMIMRKKGLFDKYHLDTGGAPCNIVTSVVSNFYRNNVTQVGLSIIPFEVCLDTMIT